MRPIKYALPEPGAADENIRRAVNALERRGRRAVARAAKNLHGGYAAGSSLDTPRAGRTARKLEETPGGPLAMRVVRRALKKR